LLDSPLLENPSYGDWAGEITEEMKQYSADCVYKLHEVKAKLDEMLERDHKEKMAKACFDFLPCRAKLDLAVGENFDVFSFNSTRI
jgi:ribonuclease D